MTAQIDGVALIKGETLLFLDEIQACGNARTALKYLAEDGRIDAIASGNLSGLTYGEDAGGNTEEPVSIPVGYEATLTMRSLDFEEFLWAYGCSAEIIDYLRGFFENHKKVPPEVNTKYEELFREFMVVGGMPKVVADFMKNKDFNRVSKIQKKILKTYHEDIFLHAKGAEKVKAKKCYDAVPKQLAKEIKKFQYSTVEKRQSSKKYGGSVQWLKESDMVNLCYNVRELYLPLVYNVHEEQFKMYINDTGLLCAMYGFETKRAILDNTIKGNIKCGIYENAIAEALLKKGCGLYYYKPDDSNEIEFLIEKNGGVVPIEVKAGNAASVSLNRFIESFKPPEAYKVVDGNIGQAGIKETIPHYMVMFL